MEGSVPSGVVMLTLIGTDGGINEEDADGDGGSGMPEGEICGKVVRSQQTQK